VIAVSSFPEHLAGLRVLVVEDTPMVARETLCCLADLGCRPIGPAATVADAEEALAGHRVDAAVVDLNLRGESAEPFLRTLAARGVPAVVASSDDRAVERLAGAGAATLLKPFLAQDLGRAMQAAIEQGRGRARDAAA